MSNKTSVLIIEDEPAIRNLISAILDSDGYRPIHAGTGKQALELLDDELPGLILLDLGLPDMDGVEILRSVRQTSSTPIIVVSAREHEKEKVTALDLGADDYIVKPFGPQELLARIRAALRPQRQAPVGRAGRSLRLRRAVGGF